SVTLSLSFSLSLTNTLSLSLCHSLSLSLFLSLSVSLFLSLSHHSAVKSRVLEAVHQYACRPIGRMSSSIYDPLSLSFPTGKARPIWETFCLLIRDALWGAVSVCLGCSSQERSNGNEE